MKKILLILIITLSSCSSNNNAIDEQQSIYENIITMCSENNCPDEVVCYSTNGDYYHAVYIYQSKYYEVAWIVSKGEYVYNDIPIEEHKLNDACLKYQ